MSELFVLLLPAFVCAGLYYVFSLLGEAILNTVSEWLRQFK